jgi:hypothetical protein
MEAIMHDEPINLGPAQWSDLNEVPANRRKLDGCRLNLEQINLLSKRENELGAWQEVSGGKFWNPDEGAARLEFIAANHVEGGMWIAGAPEPTSDQDGAA